MKTQSTMPHLPELLRFFLCDEQAATAIEYALVASLISIAIAGVATQIGTTLTEDYFEKIAEALQ